MDAVKQLLDNADVMHMAKERIVELERQLELCEASKKDMQRMVIDRDAQLNVAIEQLKDFASARWVDNVRYQAKQAIRKIELSGSSGTLEQLAAKDAQIKVAIEAFKQQCKPMYAEGGLARCLQDIATEALKQIGAGE